MNNAAALAKELHDQIEKAESWLKECAEMKVEAERNYTEAFSSLVSLRNRARHLIETAWSTQ